jgi:hypothetical protein
MLPLVRGAGCSFVDEVESLGNCLLQPPLDQLIWDFPFDFLAD